MAVLNPKETMDRQEVFENPNTIDEALHIITKTVTNHAGTIESEEAGRVMARFGSEATFALWGTSSIGRDAIPYFAEFVIEGTTPSRVEARFTENLSRLRTEAVEAVLNERVNLLTDRLRQALQQRP